MGNGERIVKKAYFGFFYDAAQVYTIYKLWFSHMVSYIFCIIKYLSCYMYEKSKFLVAI